MPHNDRRRIMGRGPAENLSRSYHRRVESPLVQDLGLNAPTAGVEVEGRESLAVLKRQQRHQQLHRLGRRVDGRQFRGVGHQGTPAQLQGGVNPLRRLPADAGDGGQLSERSLPQLVQARITGQQRLRGSRGLRAADE